MGASCAKACKGSFTPNEVQTIRLCSTARVAHQDASTCTCKLHSRSSSNVGRAAVDTPSLGSVVSAKASDEADMSILNFAVTFDIPSRAVDAEEFRSMLDKVRRAPA
eukprot:1550198-Rhodomonas_salina.1